jgi:hypothetical protein
MSIDAERVQMIRSNAALAVKELGAISGMKFGFDAESVTWVEGYLERMRKHHAESGAADGLVSVIGSFLGEANIARTGGCWIEDDSGALAILFPNGDAAFPFGKVARQFEQGRDAGESIASFYDLCVSFVATGKLSDASRGRA